MCTLFALSPDGTRIAFEHCGKGPALILVHGGGGSRTDWHQAGYIKRLQDEFTVITLDLRGHGQSDLPTDPGAYTTEKMGQDILAAADACDVDRFILWGMSYGSKICRYLAGQSDRISKLILMSGQMGWGVSGQLRQDALDFCAHWPPILQAQEDGTLDIDSLTENDQSLLQNFNVPVMLGWVPAMLQWPEIRPADLPCPTLWLVGSEDPDAMHSVATYQYSLPDSLVKLRIIAGLDHNQLFAEIDAVLPIMTAFSTS